MRKIRACVALGALTAVICSSPPAAAFGLRIGPFHIGLPLPWVGRHHHSLYMRANPQDMARPGTSQLGTSALFYPSVALPAIFQNIFWPAYSSPWPFGYQEIFATAFVKATSAQKPQLCQPPDSDASATVEHIRAELSPTPDQTELLQKLGGAIGAASGYLAKSCPSEIPAPPVARLQLMESQIEELAMAVDIIRQPLQSFEQSLNDDQKARFAAMIGKPAAADRRDRADIAIGCGGSPTAIDRSIRQIDQSVQPTDAQRGALDEMKQSFSQAASDLDAHCPTAMPTTALGRLETIEARLDSSWRAVLSIQVALANFETKLSDDQKLRFDNTDFAAR